MTKVLHRVAIDGESHMTMIKMKELDLSNKRILIREDLNVPMEGGKVTSDVRIRAALPTLKWALEANAKVMVMSHLGRPTEGEFESEYSLQPIANYLSVLLKQKVPLVKDWLDGVEVESGQLVLVENVRFNKGENDDDEVLSKKMAALCDVFVMDAFGTAHRIQASTHGVAKFAPIVCAGPLFSAELEALEKALAMPVHPMAAIVGGSKVSTKLTVLNSLSEKVDQLIVGGGIANTFLAAAGFPVGKSLYEKDLIPQAKALMTKTNIPLPEHVVVATKLSADAKAIIKNIKDVGSDDMILDFGPKTSAAFVAFLENAQTIIWNGPVGVFEFDQFGGGTKAIAMAIAKNKGFSIAGGGDTLAAIDKYNITDYVSYISTGGGAFLEFVEGKVLPSVVMLENRAKN